METFLPEQFSDNELEMQQAIEVGPEVESAIEAAREKRVGILNRIMSEKAAKVTETIGLMAPGLDIAALATSAIRGETFTGKELDSRSRFNHAAMAGFLTLSYVLLAAGEHKGALAAKGMSATVATMEFGPESIKFMKEAINDAKEKMPSIAAFMEKTGEFISGEPDLVALNLNG